MYLEYLIKKNYWVFLLLKKFEFNISGVGSKFSKPFNSLMPSLVCSSAVMFDVSSLLRLSVLILFKSLKILSTEALEKGKIKINCITFFKFGNRRTPAEFFKSKTCFQYSSAGFDGFIWRSLKSIKPCCLHWWQF